MACEEILLSEGLWREAYDRYASEANRQSTYLATIQAMTSEGALLDRTERAHAVGCCEVAKEDPNHRDGQGGECERLPIPRGSESRIDRIEHEVTHLAVADCIAGPKASAPTRTMAARTR